MRLCIAEGARELNIMSRSGLDREGGGFFCKTADVEGRYSMHRWESR